MGLIQCPECGKEVSNKATACIFCGFPLAGVQQEELDTSYSQTQNGAEKKTADKFTLFSADELSVNLECERCHKIYKFNPSMFSLTTRNECILSTDICCPSCGNMTYKGSKIYPKQEKQPRTEDKPASNDIEQAESNSGCLIYFAFLCGVIGVVFGILTDGFKNWDLWWLIFPLVFAVFLGGGGLYSLCTSDPKEVKQSWDKEKYNNYKFSCPMCGSKKVKKIGTANRAASVAVVGLASSKIGKQYECDDCKHKW